MIPLGKLIQVRVDGEQREEFNNLFLVPLGKDYDAGWVKLDIYPHTANLLVSPNWVKFVPQFNHVVDIIVFTLYNVHPKKRCNGCWNKFALSQTHCYYITEQDESSFCQPKENK